MQAAEMTEVIATDANFATCLVMAVASASEVAAHPKLAAVKATAVETEFRSAGFAARVRASGGIDRRRLLFFAQILWSEFS